MITLEGDYILFHTDGHWCIKNRRTNQYIATGDTYKEAFDEYLAMRTEQAKSIA